MQLNALLRPDSGSVVIDGRDIHADRSRLKEVRRSVGLVFQYPEHQLFEATIAKDIAFGPENLGLGKDEVQERVAWAMDLVGLPADTAEKSPFDLSGGQKRRAAIAGVLAMRPKILILDEPAAGLDPRGRDEILNNVKELHAKLGITVILVSHSMEDVARLVNRIIVINKGRIAMDGPPGDIFAKPDILENMGLAAPQAANLAHNLRARGFAVPEDAYTVEAVTEAIIKRLRERK
jgi:energy-coupling factor transport system ATP-binding protein